MPGLAPASPKVASSPGNPKTWSPCMWVTKIRRSWETRSSLRRNWCWVASPQSNSQSSARWGRRRATADTLRERVGTPELVPKKVTCTAGVSPRCRTG